MNDCLNHSDRDADFVCAVCGRYYCEECVAERFYPRPGFICHECSGEKPAPPPPAPDKAKKAEPVAESAGTSSSFLLTPSIEWGVIGLCLLVMVGLTAYRHGQAGWEPELLSNQPEDVATYCLSVLNAMEVQQATPTVDDVLGACPDPIIVTQESWAIIVSTPDADLYGFSEIEVELEPLTLTVME